MGLAGIVSGAKGALLRRLAVRANVSVGSNFHVGPGSVIWGPRSLVIGRDVYVGKNVTVEVDGTVGDGVLIANNVGLIGRRDHDIRDMGVPVRKARWVGDAVDDLSLPIVVGSDVWIGFGAVVLSGVVVGDSAIVAAGAVVTRDVEANDIVAGNPARVVGQRFGTVEFVQHWELLRSLGYRRVGQGE